MASGPASGPAFKRVAPVRPAAWRGWTALALAYALVVQLVLAGAAAALAAGPATAGEPGVPFCRPGARGADAPSSGGALPACCLLGCGLLAAMGPIPPADPLAAPHRPFARISRLDAGEDGHLPRWRRSAHLARAPPRALA